jgi:EAL and modified HD-GYP domain-containing signal transduction protein
VLEGTTPVTPPTHRTVLDVPADRCTDEEVVGRCREFLEEGYSIALDRFAWHPGIEALLEIANVVKIDLEHHTREEVLALMGRCRPFGVTLLATRCQGEDDLAWAKLAGFALFQGPAVQRPVEVSGITLAPSALAQVQLATELLDERLDFSRVEAILSTEPALVAQILHEASLGAGSGLRREVHSVRGALVLMGTVRIRQWVALTVLGRQVSNNRTDALATSLVRARMCELLAPPRGIDRAFAFTAGLLSALDRLLGVDISEVEERVDVDDALAAAAFRREGGLGELVGLVADYQDAVDNGEPTGAELGNVELMAAMAFCWAMSHITAMERTPAAA